MNQTLFPAKRPFVKRSFGATRQWHSQSGFTLVELLVAMFIGLLLIAGAAGIYLATRGLGRAQDAASIMQDYGNYTMQQLTRGVQRAGYVDWLATESNFDKVFENGSAIKDAFAHSDANKRDAFHIMYGETTGGLTGNIPSVVTTSAIFGCDGAQPATGGYSCGGTGNFSGLSIAYQSLATGTSDLSPSLNVSASGSDGSTDCNGQTPKSGTDPVNYVVNRYYVDTNNQLMCLGNGNSTTAQPIASNVIDFQVLYGLAATGTENPSKWTNAAGVTNWALVTAVQICLGLQGAAGSAPNPNSVIDCTGMPAPLQDTKMRKYFRSTINLRNATFAAKALPP